MSLPADATELRQVSSPVMVRGADPGRLYWVFKENGKAFHKVAGVDGTGRELFSEAHEIAYAVGSGATGRSYFIRRGEELFVSPLSYYAGEKRWDLSPGHDTGQFSRFTRAAGELCVSCHGELQLIPGTNNRFRQPESGQLSIGCERCHGPGSGHIAEKSAGVKGSVRAASIVNPAKLPDALRDDVCNQCHLAGDARILKPGKSYGDFRPGSALDDVVSIFSVPAALKPEGLQALGHVVQLHSSRCWIGSRGRLGCITCHNPHLEPEANKTASFFRAKCLNCHGSNGCTAAAALRQQTQPQDNCTGCHMPKRPLINISHTALTDHRILRDQNAATQVAAESKGAALIRETRPSSPPSPDTELRSVALAYAQVAANYREFALEGFSLLERAARAFPADPEVQTTYGVVLLLARPKDRQTAMSTLEHAIEVGSKSVEARLRLAGLKVDDGDASSAIRLSEQAVRLDPFRPSAYIWLAKAYRAAGDENRARAALESLLRFDPGNENAVRALSSVGRHGTDP